MPFEVPEGWAWCKIEEIAESNIGLTYKPEDVCSDGIPVLRSNNIKNRRICTDGLIRVKTHILPKQFIGKGDLLICARNGSRNLVGKCALIEQDEEPMSFGAFMAVCRSAFNRWIFLILNSSYFNQYLDNSNSTAINQVTQSMLLSFNIPLPPKNEQARIYSMVERLCSCVDELEKHEQVVLAKINDSRKRILELAIHGKLVPQDPTEEPAIELLKRINPAFEPSHNLHYEGELPNGWCFSTIGDLFRHNTGKALNGKDQVGEELRYITTSNLYWDRFDLNEVRTMPFTEAEKEKCRATKGDLLVCEGGDVGRAAIWPHDFDVMIQNHIHRLRPREDISVRFYYYIFLLYKQMGLIGGKGIAILGLSSRELDKMVVPVPPVPEQHRIVTVIENLFAQMDALISNLS